MLDLREKNILFFSPRAFGYEISIANRLKELGAHVVYFDDRPSNGFWGKAMLRAKPQLMKVVIDKYYRRIFKEISVDGHFDIIFLLNLEAMPIWFLEKTKEINPNAVVVFYMWDSLNNKPHATQYVKYCDKAYSFDPKDEGVNGLRFRPLFYLNEYKEIAAKKEYEYDLCFIGTAHSDRVRIANLIQDAIVKEDGKAFNYFYLQSKKLFFYLKYSDPNFKHSKINDFKYVSLNMNETIEMVSKSKIVLDIQHPKQTGLTMRTIEMIGAERKLITTNAAIKDYDFYSSDNILVIDREKPIINKDFLIKPYSPISNHLYYKYSIDGWLEELFTY